MAAAASWAVEVEAMGAVDLVPMLQIDPTREVAVAVELVVSWLRLVVSWADVLLARAPDLVDPAVAAAAIKWVRWATPWPVVAVEPVEVAVPVAEVVAEATVEATAGHLAVEVTVGHPAVVLAAPAAQVAVGPVTRVARATAVEVVEAAEHVATAAEATAKAAEEAVRAVEAAARAAAIAVAVVAVTHVVVCHVGALAVSHVVKHLAAPAAAMPAAQPEVVCHATVVQQLDVMVGHHAAAWTPQTFEAAAVAGVVRLPCVAEHPVDAATSPAVAAAAQLGVGKLLSPAETVLGTAAVATSIRSNSHWWGSCLCSKACPLECRWL